MSEFLGWVKVSEIISSTIKNNNRLNTSQKTSVKKLIEYIQTTGIIIADEVGMGKTRIAVELIHAVKKAGGRTAVIIPNALGFQWQQELNEREKELAPSHTITSLRRFMSAWEDKENLEPWDEKSVVLVTHNFANWQIGGRSDSSRWSLLPLVYAHWRKKETNQFPRNYLNNDLLSDSRSKYCAERIIKHVSSLPKTDNCRKILKEIEEKYIWGKDSLSGEHYSKGNDYQVLLERTIGLGLGSFDLVVIDEAHKSRGDSSILNRVLNNVIIQNSTTRRLAVTATPVELDISQWKTMLDRIQLSEDLQTNVLTSIYHYSDAVNKLQKYWKSDKGVRDEYKKIAREFETSLKPYLLRRDKRHDKTVQAFKCASGLPINSYRKEISIDIEVNGLNDQWKNIICSVEGLSAASSMQEDSVSKRARLTLANGHGIAGIIDQATSCKNDEECDDLIPVIKINNKKSERAAWWKNKISKTYQSGNDSLYQHPAILKIIENIEADLNIGQKALVFGKLTKPMRVLVNLLNARQMLRQLKYDKFWPQRKIHGNEKTDDLDSEFSAVQVALQQLNYSWSISEVNGRLKSQYDKHSKFIDTRKHNLIDNIEESVELLDKRCRSLFSAFKDSIDFVGTKENTSLIYITRAIYEISEAGGNDLTPEQAAQGFIDLMGAVTAENEGDIDGDGELDEDEANELWPSIEERIREEFAHVRGGMARLMYGGTSAASRRVLQLGFNRKNSFPSVLVAQSVVGREGLNLHQACRIVYLMHPEWNPGVVEQQIGRIDRLGSRWEKEFLRAQKNGTPAKELPFIEVKSIIFKGTYDEYNWQVLRSRSNQLRSQLHGVVIPESGADNSFDDIREDLNNSAPSFY